MAAESAWAEAHPTRTDLGILFIRSRFLAILALQTGPACDFHLSGSLVAPAAIQGLYAMQREELHEQAEVNTALRWQNTTLQVTSL